LSTAISHLCTTVNELFMSVKIDTKEKFSVLTLETGVLTAQLAAALTAAAENLLQMPIKNVILSMKGIMHAEPEVLESLVKLQQRFYEQNASFVICEMRNEVETLLDEAELLELMNVTPSESEAWDIVQMEEIERELLDGDDMAFNQHPAD
jgi:anti-anti-sigma regulatory factor